VFPLSRPHGTTSTTRRTRPVPAALQRRRRYFRLTLSFRFSDSCDPYYRRAAGNTCFFLRPKDIKTACVRSPDLPFYHPIEPWAEGILLACGPTPESPVISDLAEQLFQQVPGVQHDCKPSPVTGCAGSTGMDPKVSFENASLMLAVP